ncbi:MAG: hypothetical protein IPK39_20520 [Sulfuritalea sp.]|nr:hypothetical protein [Sulfuritalea sp.]
MHECTRIPAFAGTTISAVFADDSGACRGNEKPGVPQPAPVPASLVLLASAMPVHAFQPTVLADGSFEYFFAAPSLDIRSAGDLDLTGLSFIDGVEGGFRVGASFNLDWLGGEKAWLASPASTWSGLDTLPRRCRSLRAAASLSARHSLP